VKERNDVFYFHVHLLNMEHHHCELANSQNCDNVKILIKFPIILVVVSNNKIY